MTWERTRRVLIWALGALLVWTWLYLADQDQPEPTKPTACYASELGSCDGFEWSP